MYPREIRNFQRNDENTDTMLSHVLYNVRIPQASVFPKRAMKTWYTTMINGFRISD